MKTLPSFWPVVTIIIAIIEVGLLAATIITGGLAPISFTPKTVTESILWFDNITEIGLKEIVPNFFIGTSKAALIHTGAMYTPVSLIAASYKIIYHFFSIVHARECKFSSASCKGQTRRK